ncbi:MAG: hypothetical protein ABI134_20685 [Byssovorax sp.]
MPPTPQPSRQVLEEIPTRSLKLLSALSRSSIIHAALAARGYTEPDHQEGWELLLQVTGFRRPAVAAAESTAARDATVEIDAWDEPNFRLIRAALDRRHPEQSLFVFEGLTASTGAGAVVGVATLLDRLDALEKSPERKATRKADQAALDTLAKRGIPTAERARLRALVTTAMTAAKAEEDASDAADDGAPNEALLKLHAWYGEWSEVARAVIKRRDHLIRLGLAKRKKTAKGAAGTPT